MARPRPSAVVRLRAKTDTSVIPDSTCSTRNVPTIDRTPMASGRVAATTLPKITTSSTSVIGRAIISARSRSSSMVVPTSRNTSADPPSSTATAPSSRS